MGRVGLDQPWDVIYARHDCVVLEKIQNLRQSFHAFMTPQDYYLGALGLFGIGVLCFLNTSILAVDGGRAYEAKRARRFIGGTLIFAAALCLAIGLYSQSSEVIPPGVNVTNAGPVTGAVVNPGRPSVSQPLPIPALAPHPAVAETESLSLPGGYQLTTNESAMIAPPAAGNAALPRQTPMPALLQRATQLLAQSQFEPALNDVNAALQEDRKNPAIYALRANIHAAQHLWKQAEADYATVLQLDSANLSMKFDLAQIEYAQKKYDAARPLFAAAQKDPDIGDLARYEVFLCDLFGGHEDAAAREIDAFDKADTGASYYFSNAAWSLYHHDKANARGWLVSAAHIYAPTKFKLYVDSLVGVVNSGASAAPPPSGLGSTNAVAH